jgi:hypothetical protein
MCALDRYMKLERLAAAGPPITHYLRCVVLQACAINGYSKFPSSSIMHVASVRTQERVQLWSDEVLPQGFRRPRKKARAHAEATLRRIARRYEITHCVCRRLHGSMDCLFECLTAHRPVFFSTCTPANTGALLNSV